MAAAAPVLLVLGAGPNIGAAVGRLFGQHGYKVALASRKASDGPGLDGTFNVKVDLSQPETVKEAFEKVTSALGAPGVVVYNAASNTSAPPSSPLDLSLSLSSVNRDLAINTTSALVAAHEATRSFATLPDTAARTFIYTGNILNTEPILPLLSLGIGKSAAAHIVHTASIAYHSTGAKFYYADERNADGSVAGGKIDGGAHAAFYWDLAQQPEQGPWRATFVKGKGYTPFEGIGYVKNASL